MKKYAVDACAVIAYLRDEEGSDKFENLLKISENQFVMHSVNLGEVYYDALRTSGKNRAQELFDDISQLPIKMIWNLDEQFIKTVGKYKTSYRVSYADCFLLALAEQESAIVISTDHHEFDVIENADELKFCWLRG
jgi:PIN domain nuclease of toxin-antitoxin system